MGQWLVMALLVTLVEHISPHESSESEEYPLTKSLGYAIRSGIDKADSRLSQEFLEKYREMRKASQESYENFEKREEKRRRRVIVEDELDLIKEASVKNRRRSSKLQSDVGRRRARSQALRRDKLNTQSLRSHMHHSKQTNLEYVND